jgi:multidrug efflux pump subunit AcrA (membrane-fusion protein)
MRRDKKMSGPQRDRKAPPVRRKAEKAFGGAQKLLVAVAIGVVSLIAWASIARIDEVVRAHGQIIAVARTQVIQATEGGVLEKALVQEGEQVKKGQLLVQLDDKRAKAAYEDSFNKVTALRATLVRLKAEVFGQPLAFTSEIPEEFKRNQTELFRRRKQVLDEGIGALQKGLNYLRAELVIVEPLLASGDVGEVEVVRLLRQESEIKGQIVNIRNKYFQDAQSEMTKVEEDLANAEQIFAERKVVLEYTDLRAPVDGLVKQIHVTTLGASVQQGEVIMELLPTDSDLILEAKVMPSDVAFVHVGLPVSVKLDAFDSSIYGALDGKVTYVSPDALTQSDPRAGEIVFYRVRVRVVAAAKTQNPKSKEIVVQPGMTGIAEIKTRERTVLTYLTKPVTKTFSSALTER